MVKWYKMPIEILNTAEYVNYGFAFIFLIESIIKLLGFRKRFFLQSWNLYEIIIVSISLISIFLSSIRSIREQFKLIEVVIIMARVARLFRFAEFS